MREQAMDVAIDGGFDNRFLRELPGDPVSGNQIRSVQGAAWSRVMPTPVVAPALLLVAEDLLAELGLPPEWIADRAALAEVMAGNRQWPGMDPWAACYGGHQFGHWAGQLGDGRAISLGEWLRDGRRHELQLKGAGPTPYSRRADGRAVLRSSIREFLCSEAMHHLGVPTTRALTLVVTGEAVVRDMFYSGDPKPEPGAIVCRVAPSFLRFGNFELPAARGDLALLRRLAAFMLDRDFPELTGDFETRLAASFALTVERSAALVAQWMALGFVHGVMNTDNCSVLGLTLDYGPYGWVEEVDPAFTPNTTDAEGRRYCYGRQPAVMAWNLARYGSALAALLPDPAPLQRALEGYSAAYGRAYGERLAAKLGLPDWQAGDDLLAQAWYDWLERAKVDLTLGFRHLSEQRPETWTPEAFAPAAYDPIALTRHAAGLLDWRERYRARLADAGIDEATRQARMQAVNPVYLPRNWLAQEAIDAAEQGDLAPLQALYAALRQPFQHQPGREHQARKRPDWARHRAGCSMLSCSS
jgi:uncharacterized protein YdiU (UPF0061 family)